MQLLFSKFKLQLALSNLTYAIFIGISNQFLNDFRHFCQCQLEQTCDLIRQ